MPRLFIAIEIPESEKEKICEIRRNLRCVKWTPREQLHLTLSFIGDSDEDSFAKIRNALSGVSFSPFTLETGGADFFPNERRPTVFWLGFAACRELEELKKGIDLALEPHGVPPEKRNFTPHLTIARLRFAGKKETDRILAVYGALPAMKFEAKEFVLYKSELTPEGATHTPLQTYAGKQNRRVNPKSAKLRHNQEWTAFRLRKEATADAERLEHVIGIGVMKETATIVTATADNPKKTSADISSHSAKVEGIGPEFFLLGETEDNPQGLCDFLPNYQRALSSSSIQWESPYLKKKASELSNVYKGGYEGLKKRSEEAAANKKPF